MRVETKTVVRECEESKFIDFDGAEFDSHEDCMEHENALKEVELQNAIKNIREFSLYPPECDIDFEYHWYLVNSVEELNVVKEFHFYDPDAYGYEFEPEKYPALIRVEVVGDTGYGNILDYESVLGYAESYLESLQDLGGVLDSSDESEEE